MCEFHVPRDITHTQTLLTHSLTHWLSGTMVRLPWSSVVQCFVMYFIRIHVNARSCVCVRITIKLLCTLVPAVKSLNQKLLLHYAHFFFFIFLLLLPCVYITRVSRPQKYTHTYTRVRILFRHHQTKPDIAIVSKKTIQTMQL